MRAVYDFAPLYRSMIGADHVAALVENALRGVGVSDDPPYDIEKTADDGYRISLAVAGFRQDELDVSVEPNLLVIRGRKTEPAAQGAYVHQGLALRPFERRFELADHVMVRDAYYADGLLTITLTRELPEPLKPRRIEINRPRLAPLKGLLDRKHRSPVAA